MNYPRYNQAVPQRALSEPIAAALAQAAQAAEQPKHRRSQSWIP